MCSLLGFVLQRELQISLLWYTCETRLPAQQTPRRHAVYGPQTTTCSAETKVPQETRPAYKRAVLAVWHKLPFFKTLRWAIWFQVQACAEVWCLLWGELLRWRPATSWCSRADGHCTEPTPPAVPRSVAFLYIWMSVKTKNTRDALKYSDECSVFRLFHSGNFIALIYFLFPQQMHRGHSLTL